MELVDIFNQRIKKAAEDGFPGFPGQISDGDHTFEELYEHRSILFICLCSVFPKTMDCWKSKKHHDGTMYEGYFIAGMGYTKGRQVSYHLALDLWDSLKVKELVQAPQWDGHTSEDVLTRLREWFL